MSNSLIFRVLREPWIAQSLSLTDWDLLIRQGRRANLLGRLHALFFDSRIIDSLPQSPALHLSSADALVQRQVTSIRWEISCIAEALSTVNTEVILLKGAAYVMSNARAAQGRTFSDVDVLVRKSQIANAEKALMIHGWHGSDHSAYDQRYYRRWMHEIPPMAHVKRGTTIDLHHGILPETARIQVDTPALFENLIPVQGYSNVFVLRPEDMLLHSATHLFHEGELDNGLRDLTDLDLLFRQFGESSGFWSSLVERAERLGLQTPLFYAVFFCRRLLKTTFPDEFLREIEQFSPNGFLRRVMACLYDRGFQANHASCRLPGDGLARLMLYIRAHWIKMPFPLLAYHLSFKVFKQLQGKSKNHNQEIRKD